MVPGAALAFERTLAEAVERFGWGGRVTLSNHFHLALETPGPNLSEGMHWLLTTYCSRHNRFRARQGHLFQGRYKSLLIENAAYLDCVVDYIHLNPVRARLVPPHRLGDYRTSSLWWWLKPRLPEWFEGTSAPRRGAEKRPWPSDCPSRIGRGDRRTAHRILSRGWAIGTAGWRKALAKEQSDTPLGVGLKLDELRGLPRDCWQRELEAGLAELGKTLADAERDAKGAGWKIDLARRLRVAANAPHRWIARTPPPRSRVVVRAYLAASSD